MTRVDLITLQQIRDAEPADKMQTKHAQQERVYRNTEPRDGFVDDGLVPIDKWGPPTEGGSTLPEPATDAEPFGYWVKYKCTEGQFVRMPAYIAPDGPNNKSTPLYTRPTPSRCDELVTVGWLWEYAQYRTDDRGYYGYETVITESNPTDHVSPAEKLRNVRELVTRQNAEEVIAAKDARIDEYETGLVQMHQEMSALEADNKRLREALSIFLGDATMEGLLWGDAKSTDLVTIRVQKKNYDFARAALGEVKS